MLSYIKTQEEMKLIEDSWNNLEGLFGSPIYTHEWFSSCAEAFCPPHELRILSVKNDDHIDAIAPLASTGRWIKRMELLGSSILLEPGGVLYRNPEVLKDLLNSVVKMKTPLFLKGLKLVSEEANFWESEIKAGRLIALINEERIPWVSTLGRWDDFEKEISPSRRSSLRRLERLAQSKGKIEFDVVVPTEEDVNRYLEEIFAVEALSWKGRIGTALKSEQKLGHFFKEYSRKTARKGELHLFFLRVDGKTVAVDLATVHANRLWIFKVGHDETWSWCSPGILLMHRVIKFCFEQGLQACEMLGSNEQWLHIWAKEIHGVTTYRIYPKSISGIVAMGLDLIEMQLHRVIYVIKKGIAKRKDSNHV